VHRGDDQVAFVLASAIIGDNNDFTGLKGADGFNNTGLIIAWS
jgi:hypothetical protein